MNRTCQLNRDNHNGEVSLVLMRNLFDHASLCEHHGWLYNEGFLTLQDITDSAKTNKETNS